MTSKTNQEPASEAQGGKPSLDLFFETVHSFYKTEAFKAAQLYNDKLAREYLQRMMYEFLIKAQQINEDAIVKIAGDLGFDRTKLFHDMNSKRVGEAVKRDVGAMERDHATFLDLIVITPDGNSERISDAFEAKSVARVIERMVPGLPRSI